MIVQKVRDEESFFIFDPIVLLYDCLSLQFTIRTESPGILTTAQLLLASMAASQKHLLPVPHHNHSFVLMDGHLSPSPTIKDAASTMNVNVR